MIALKGWPIIGCVPQMYKAVNNTGYNDFYHKWQQKLGPIYKIKGLGMYINRHEQFFSLRSVNCRNVHIACPLVPGQEYTTGIANVRIS